MASKTRHRTGISDPTGPQFKTSDVAIVNDRTVTGFALDPEALESRFTVEILLDGQVKATAYADMFVPELHARGIGDGCYGFAIDLDRDLVSTAQTLEARRANVGTPVGRPIELATIGQRNAVHPNCSLQWLGGLRFVGWIDTTAEKILEAVVDGEKVAQVRATGWTHLEDENKRHRNVRAFDFHLPERLADGSVHELRLHDDTGEFAFPPTNCVAFPGGLAATLELVGEHGEQLLGSLYDLFVPASLPLTEYAAWRDRFPVRTPECSDLELAIIIAGTAGADRTLATIEGQTHANWTAAVIDGPALALDPDALAEFLDEAEGRSAVHVFVVAGTLLHSSTLARIAQAFDTHQDASILYGDLDVIADDGTLWPIAFPAFDYERLLEQGYCSHLFALRRHEIVHIRRSRAESLYRAFNSMFDRDDRPARHILHLPGSLATLPKVDRRLATSLLTSATEAHLNERGVSSSVKPSTGALFPAVKVQRAISRQKTTIVIPTRDRLPLLRACIESIRPAIDRSRADVLIVDNDSRERETLSYLEELAGEGIGVLRVEGVFNFARLNNRAAAMLDSDILCLLNNDVEATSDDWLEEMLSRLAEPDVGAVGSLLSWPGGMVQHGGVVLGVNFGAGHAFTGRDLDSPGYLDLLRVAHECSAVTAACLMTRRQDYLRVGGMDENYFPVAFNDVDYCLKLRETGKRIVFTPHARLIHAESSSRGRDEKAEHRGRFERELEMLRARWGSFLAEDPSYSPELSRDGIPYSALAWPPGSRKPRSNFRPNARDLSLLC